MKEGRDLQGVCNYYKNINLQQNVLLCSNCTIYKPLPYSGSNIAELVFFNNSQSSGKIPISIHYELDMCHVGCQQSVQTTDIFLYLNYVKAKNPPKFVVAEK